MEREKEQDGSQIQTRVTHMCRSTSASRQTTFPFNDTFSHEKCSYIPIFPIKGEYLQCVVTTHSTYVQYSNCSNSNTNHYAVYKRPSQIDERDNLTSLLLHPLLLSKSYMTADAEYIMILTVAIHLIFAALKQIRCPFLALLQVHKHARL